MSTPTDEHDQGVWLTQEAHDRLKAELDQLVAGRPAMSAEDVVTLRWKLPRPANSCAPSAHCSKVAGAADMSAAAGLVT